MTRAWIIWASGAMLVPLSGIVMSHADKHCSGFWPTDIVTHHRCVGVTPAVVWLMWLAAFASMTAAMLQLERASLRSVAVAQLLAGLAFVATPTMPTADAYAYHVYGVTDSHWNPWQPTRLVPHREAIATGIRIWGNPMLFPSPYGPLFIVYERGLTTSLPTFTADQLIYVERFLDLLCALAITLLLPGARVAWWALQPLVLFEFALAAHCDILMLTLLAVSLRMRNSVLAGIAIGCSGAIKVIGLGASVFRRSALPSTIATVAVLLLVFPAALTTAPLTAGAYGFSGSPALLTAVALHALHVPQAPTIARLAVLVVGVIVAIGLRVQRRDVPAYGTLLLIACSTWIVPWYLTWAIFASRFAHRQTAVAVSIIASASLLLEAGNQVSLVKTNLAESLAFLLVTALALNSVCLRGALQLAGPVKRALRRIEPGYGTPGPR